VERPAAVGALGLIFLVADLGPTDGAGDWSGTLDVPDDPALVGLTYHAQIAFFGDDGSHYLTNAVARAVDQ
jgi:hypothetical protein